MKDDYQRIASAIQFLKNSSLNQSDIHGAAQHIGLSLSHFQQLFHRFAGVSPKLFLQSLTTKHTKKMLKQSAPILETSFDIEVNSSNKLQAVTPEEHNSDRKNLEIRYAIHPTPFGNSLIAITQRGICRLEFIDPDDEENGVTRLKRIWQNAQFIEDKESTAKIIEQIFNQPEEKPLALLLQGTNFQLKVWKALLQIPTGCVISYGNLAQRIGHPKASRAIGTAIGNNPISYLIPCHRVLRANGEIGGYRWGVERKMAILGLEMSKKSQRIN